VITTRRIELDQPLPNAVAFRCVLTCFG